MTEHAEIRRKHRIEELSSAAMRAVSGEPDVAFRGGVLHRGRHQLPLRVPHLRVSKTEDELASYRGAADGVALRLRYSDPALHARLRPEPGVERLVFDLLEQFRVEAAAPEQLPGLVHNLRYRHVRWSLDCHRAGLTESARGLLFYTVAQVCRSHITGQPVVAETEDLIESARVSVASALGAELAALRRERGNQGAFARHARAVATTVAAMLHRPDNTGPDDADDADESDEVAGFELPLDFDADAGDLAEGSGRGGGERGDAAPPPYRVFTTAYDREVAAGALVRREALREQREWLDQRVVAAGSNVPRLARELRAALATPTPDGWQGGQEEGHVDGRALAQLIASPTERRLFRADRIEPVADALVTFLIDCSGSMKQHGEAVAVLVDTFTRALDLAGAACEVLGFTTGAWHGGRARRDWLRAGRPRNPGRLNEQCHVVFKDAATPWRRARLDIAALLKPDLFREGLDGEALEWAARRAQRGDERRRLLFVLSDGSPMDTATALANGERYLDNHLKDVAEDLEHGGAVELYGLGVGLDLSPYYRRSLALDVEELGRYRAVREILGLMARR